MREANVFKALALAGVVAGLVVADARPARACGGCFPSRAAEATVVNEHRMVFSVSQTQTTLWDQIKYSGSPKDFAWVLPVHPGTTVELSHDEFMAALDAYTQPVIASPIVTSKGSAFSCGFGGSASSTSLASPTPENPGVTVVSEQVVGPYEAVTLRATNGDSLNTWLLSHQYDIPAAVQPIIDAYVKEQFDFIALRLLPNEGVSAMAPVRVVTQGADPTLPLRMVAAGVGQTVGVLLYVISEGRYRTQNFRDVTIDDSQLVWDTAQNQSNYAALADAAMTGGDGRGVLTEFAGHAFHNDFSPLSGTNYNSYFSSLTQAYTSATSTCDAGTNVPRYDASVSNPDAGDGDVDASDDASAAPDGDLADASVDDAGVDDAAAPDAGLTNPCDFDDIDVATKGMNTNDVWITRLRMHLPVAALGDDLRLEASSPQATVSPYHQVPGQDSSGCSEARGGISSTWLSAAMGAFVALFLARRRQRPRL